MVQSDDVPYVDKQAGILPDDFVVYQNARSTKSWFLLDDEIVVLAAGVADPAGRAVVTTVDSRIADPSDDVVVTRDRGWVRYANGTEGTSVGYLVPAKATVEQVEVTRSRRVVRASNPDTPVTKNVFTVSIRGTGELAFALVPNATEHQLRAYRKGPLKILSNTQKLQAIEHTRLGITATNTFTGGWHHAGRLVVDGPASVIVRRQGREVAVAVSDPTMDRDRVSVLIHGGPYTVISYDDGVAVRRVPGGTMVTATTRQAYGRSFTATLRMR